MGQSTTVSVSLEIAVYYILTFSFHSVPLTKMWYLGCYPSIKSSFFTLYNVSGSLIRLQDVELGTAG